MGFVQTKYKGQDEEAAAKFYQSQFKAAKKLGRTDEEAHKHAAFMVDYYGHQFRKYS